MTDNNVALAAITARLGSRQPSNIPSLILAAAEIFHDLHPEETRPFQEWILHQVAFTYKELLLEMGWWFRTFRKNTMLILQTDDRIEIVQRFLKHRTAIENDLIRFEINIHPWRFPDLE